MWDVIGWTVIAKQKTLFFRGSEHQSFADTTYFMRGSIGKKIKSRGELDPYLCGKIHSEMCVAFLQQYASKRTWNTFSSLIYRISSVSTPLKYYSLNQISSSKVFL